MRRIRPRSVYDVIALISLFLVVGGGTALASLVVASNSQIGPNTVSGHKPPAGKHANIINGSINSLDLSTSSVGSSQLKLGAVKAIELGNSAVTTPKIANTAVTGNKLATGAVSSAKLQASAIGASGMVGADGTLARGFNVANVAHSAGTGIYCITPNANIDPASSVMVVTPNFSQDDTAGGGSISTHVEWASTGCLDGSMAVHTFLICPSCMPDPLYEDHDEGFSFSIRPS